MNFIEDGRPRIAAPRVAALAVILCVGCGEQWQAETHPAHGQITINGEPPAGAIVELHAIGPPADERNSRPWAVVQDDGSYTLTTYESGDGAPAGEYAVVVKWSPDVSQPSLVDRLDGAYADAQNPVLEVTIAEGENELPPIEITGARVRPKEQAQPPRGGPPGPGMGA